MIKNIIFDIGGVIIFQDIKLMSKTFLELFPNNFQEIMDIWNTNKILLNTGKISSKELIAMMNEKIDSNFSNEYLYEKFIDAYKKDSINLNTELLQWIKENKNNYRIFSLSDTIDIHLECNINKNIFEDFEQTFNSNIEGIAKAQGEIAFINLINKTKINPEDSLFIDDLAVNVEQAKKLGFKTILYVNNWDLLKKLNNYSI